METDKVEGPQDSSEVGKEGEASTAEEERLAAEKSRRLREDLAQKAMEDARNKKEAETLFQMSQRAYGRGGYDRSVEMLEAALTKVSGSSNLGDEVRVGLQMNLGYDCHDNAVKRLTIRWLDFL
ncbi:uncharacterized protein [Physcomitrium patens]|uniref:Uncharacterized protein n=1 Tax=Physcomitrium patens TaxID=3218 RepID=A0A2K1KHN8_PHYPA|nr:uncharacterized protein LOC112283882 [Physcomitrium patens]XP_024378957.1 uncharacterized protein LOC112283882 [Physcomitrium patens]XP_024378958.1 uncharacterized protein LOC112283882 [Physcomitrium patens]PNR53273.1 hypothetical protein PHYPA_009649 [Physcomitrium patens]|eukprot:XP_024378956.1 uncharacterized protein LOC112283882 [Physcomitrella patens]